MVHRGERCELPPLTPRDLARRFGCGCNMYTAECYGAFLRLGFCFSEAAGKRLRIRGEGVHAIVLGLSVVQELYSVSYIGSQNNHRCCSGSSRRPKIVSVTVLACIYCGLPRWALAAPILFMLSPLAVSGHGLAQLRTGSASRSVCICDAIPCAVLEPAIPIADDLPTPAPSRS